MSTSTTGTGTITLGSALSGYQSFTAAGLTTGAITRYTIQDGVNWEIGIGTYTTSGTTLTRTPSESSSGGSAINLSGNAEVFITAAAEDVSPLYDANFVTQTTSSFNGPSATGTDAIAIGLDALASGTRSVGIGALATGTNVGAIATGNGAVALGGSNASGTEAFSANNSRNNAAYGSTGANSVTLGYQSRAQATYSVAIGYAAIAGGQYGIALGFSRANGEQSFSIGQNASTASGENTIVIGKAISSSVNNEIAIGGTGNTIKLFDAYTLPTTDGSAGTALVTNGSGALSFSSVGADLYAANPVSATNPTAQGDNSISIGSGASDGSSGYDNAIAIGTSALAEAARSVSIGKSTNSGTDGVGIGTNAHGGGNTATAVGAHTDARSLEATALGAWAQAWSGSGATAIAKSYASGSASLAAAIANNSSSYGATGTNSIAMGYQAKARDTRAVSIGYNTDVNGYGGVAIGNDCYVNQGYGVAMGNYARTHARYGAFIYANGYLADAGDAQTGVMVLRKATTDATPSAITSTGGAASSSNQLILTNESAITFTGTVVVREDATDGDDYAGWEIKGVIMRQGQASDTTLGVGIVNKLYHTAGLANASVALSADTSNGALQVEATGIAATNLHWVATLNFSEVKNF